MPLANVNLYVSSSGKPLCLQLSSTFMPLAKLTLYASSSRKPVRL